VSVLVTVTFGGGRLCVAGPHAGVGGCLTVGAGRGGGAGAGAGEWGVRAAVGCDGLYESRGCGGRGCDCQGGGSVFELAR
jgi:hypothetical protein